MNTNKLIETVLTQIEGLVLNNKDMIVTAAVNAYMAVNANKGRDAAYHAATLVCDACEVAFTAGALISGYIDLEVNK